MNVYWVHRVINKNLEQKQLFIDDVFKGVVYRLNYRWYVRSATLKTSSYFSEYDAMKFLLSFEKNVKTYETMESIWNLHTKVSNES